MFRRGETRKESARRASCRLGSLDWLPAWAQQVDVGDRAIVREPDGENGLAQDVFLRLAEPEVGGQ
ncbi:hypothetical protein ACWZHB_16405 [Nocardia sp. FBN12]|uniref:hypothetical protein n=1 Tax=Nocardia sp. FBN12 TaxID=3419766 RepID=UPI003D07792D